MGAVETSRPVGLTDEMARNQLHILIEDRVFRSSRRSVAFLRYIVEQTLQGSADALKERTIGVEVFGRDPSYDTNEDHVVRTAATELRKRLAIYYGEPNHRSEIHIALHPGSYVPQFTLPLVAQEDALAEGAVPHRKWKSFIDFGLVALLLFAIACVVAPNFRRKPLLHSEFWNPVLHSGEPVLIVTGDVPNGPPMISSGEAEQDVPPLPRPGASDPPTVPFGDAVTIAHVASVLTKLGGHVIIRREGASSFADLRESPVVLVGAFNNTWSLRLTRSLRFSLAMDPGHHLIYIRDREHPNSRQWSWNIGPHVPNGNIVSSTPLHDYALISRVVDSPTGHTVVIIGGLYVYGTQAAGVFLSSSALVSLMKNLPLREGHKNLQIVLETDVTQQPPGPPRVVAFAGN